VHHLAIWSNLPGTFKSTRHASGFAESEAHIGTCSHLGFGNGIDALGAIAGTSPGAAEKDRFLTVSERLAVIGFHVGF
jgi:hypothetical protein